LATGLPPRYSGKCRGLSQAEVEARKVNGDPATLRFRVAEGKRVEFEDKVRGPQVFYSDDIGDFVIRRSDGTPAFFFCNAIDDALMGVTLVVRGEDHLTNTPRQIMLLQTLGLSVPEYAHIAMVVGADGAPLSKRTGSKSVEELRIMGYLPAAIHNYLARLGHTYDANAFMDLQMLADNFDISRLHRAPARFDETQMHYWQREAIMHLPSSTVRAWMGEAVKEIVPVDRLSEFIEAVRGNIAFPIDALRWAQIVFTDKLTVSRSAQEAITAAGKNFFDEARRAVDKHGSDFKAVSDTLKRNLALSGKPLFQPLRAALTGELDGPEMARLLPLISADRARERFSRFAT
jgi:glutamyl-tRNA synthetase